MTSPKIVVTVALFALASIASASDAQQCGDADGNGSVGVLDGVQTLRKAAGLESICTVAACDVDGNGSISVTDGVNVLRLAADLTLPAIPTPCSAAILGCGDIPGCPPYPADCEAQQLPVDEDVVGVGGRACGISVTDTEILISDTEIGRGAPLVIDHEREQTLFGVQVADDEGDFLGAQLTIRQIPTMQPDGSIVFDFPADSPDAGEPRAQCGNLRDGSVKISINGFHQRLVIRRICGETERIVGCFKTEVQLEDGSQCEVRGEFMTFRTDDMFP